MNSNNEAMAAQMIDTVQRQDSSANALWTTLSDEQQEQVQGGMSWQQIWAMINKNYKLPKNLPATA